MLELEVSGQKEVEDRLVRLVEALDVGQILDEMEALLLNRIRTRFLQQVNPDGVPWKESFAAKERKSKGRGGGTLFDTGRLFHSIQAFAEDENTRAIGTNVEYAPQHQFGLNGNEVRQFLGFGGDDVQVATALVKKRIDEALNG